MSERAVERTPNGEALAMRNAAADQPRSASAEQRRGKADMSAFASLRRVAENADHGRRPWVIANDKAYPQTILREGDVALIANTFTDPGHDPVEAEFIATFDPPMVLWLLDLVEGQLEEKQT